MKRPTSVRAECIERGNGVNDATVTQTLTFGNAIMAGIEEVCKEQHAAHQTIEMRAVLGALVSVMAHYIAGIPDEERSIAFQRCGEELRDMIATNVELGTCARTYSQEDFVQ